MKTKPVRFVFDNKQRCMVPWKPKKRKNQKPNPAWVDAKYECQIARRTPNGWVFETITSPE